MMSRPPMTIDVLSATGPELTAGHRRDQHTEAAVVLAEFVDIPTTLIDVKCSPRPECYSNPCL